MKQDVLVVTDKLIQELRRIWIKEQHVTLRMSEIIKRINREFDLTPHDSEAEIMILYGKRRKPVSIQEKYIGQLIAIAPGIVILDTTIFMSLISGLISRIPKDVNTPLLFDLTPFSSETAEAALYICDFSSDENKKKLFVDCPVEICWSIGAGHGESYEYLGIDSSRWEVMEEWLDKWLPPE